MATKKTESNQEITIELLARQQTTIYVIGESPLIMNRLAEKARRELLFPKGRMTDAEKKLGNKHNPIEEYRSSPDRIFDESAPTLLALPATAFKGALRSVAIDVSGSSKAQLGRLTYVKGDLVGIYGIPKMLMSVVRCADKGRTPDIRTRAIIEKWAASFDISFATPLLNLDIIGNLLGNAGEIIGVGDWRPEKGAGAFGRFRLVKENDPEYKAIVKAGGRAAQARAMENPDYYNADTAELHEWFEAEKIGRGKAESKPSKTSKLKKVA